MKSDDSQAKQWAYVNVCRFIAVYETPPKIILQVTEGEREREREKARERERERERRPDLMNYETQTFFYL